MAPKLLLVTALCFLAAHVYAEDTVKTGRLPDGRAYRLDPQGNEIVDYLAELELNVESLNRRVGGLEDELQEKNLEIERLSQGRSAQGLLKERDLGAGQPVKAAPGEHNQFEIEQTSAVKACPACPRAVCPPAPAFPVGEPCDCSAFEHKYEQKLGAEHAVKRKAAALSDQVSDLRSDLEAREAALQDLKIRLEQAGATIETLRANVKVSEEKRIALERELETNKRVARQLAQSDTGGQPAGGLTTVRVRALDSVKGKIQNDFSQLKGLIAARDAKYQVYNSKRSAVVFKPSPLVSSRNLTLKDIGQRIEEANSIYALSILGRDMSEIRARVQDDLALMQRMERVR